MEVSVLDQKYILDPNTVKVDVLERYPPGSAEKPLLLVAPVLSEYHKPVAASIAPVVFILPPAISSPPR